MSLKATFTMPGIYAYISSRIEKAEAAQLETYKFAGEQFVRLARLNGTYNDITGNLRSSIGYVIIKDGKQLASNFEEAGNGTDKATGVTTAEGFAEEVAERFPKGLALIVVAGMKYAAAVESKNLDVITGTALTIEEELRSLLQTL